MTEFCTRLCAAVFGVAWRSPHSRARRYVLATAIAMCGASAMPAFAQDGAFVEASGDFSPVSIGTYDTTWRVARALGGVQRDGVFGWLIGAERHERSDLSDVAIQAGGFRRAHGWTLSGLAGFSHEPQFLYERSFEGELAREIGRGFVVHGGFRYLAFPVTRVNIVQPGASWYFRHGDIQGRIFLVDNETTDRRSTAGVFRTSLDVSPRVRLGAGIAAGTRIFDVTSFSRTQQGWALFGNARVAVAPHWFVTVGAGGAHEDPFFSQRTFSASLRWTF